MKLPVLIALASDLFQPLVASRLLRVCKSLTHLLGASRRPHKLHLDLNIISQILLESVGRQGDERVRRSMRFRPLTKELSSCSIQEGGDSPIPQPSLNLNSPTRTPRVPECSYS